MSIIDQTAASQAASIAVEILVPVVTVFLLWAANRVIKIIEKKTGIDVPEKQEALLDKWIEQGITLASEKAHKKLKESKALEGPEKLEIAADYVHQLVLAQGWIDWTKGKIESKIEAKLGKKRSS